MSLRLLRWVRSGLAALLVTSPLIGTGAQAQPIETATDQNYETLFSNVLRDPSNLDLSFRFAEAATQRNDFEAAIGSLERFPAHELRADFVIEAYKTGAG